MRRVRNYTQIEKQQVVEEVKTIGSITKVANTRGIPTSTIHCWLQKDIPTKKLSNQQLSEIKQLKQKLSDKELENQILKELLKKTYQVWDKD